MNLFFKFLILAAVSSFTIDSATAQLSCKSQLIRVVDFNKEIGNLIQNSKASKIQKLSMSKKSSLTRLFVFLAVTLKKSPLKLSDIDILALVEKRLTKPSAVAEVVENDVYAIID